MTDDEFLERWRLWREALNGREDSHSLVQQVETLCWNVAVFEALMASWKTETSDDGETLQVNSILFHFTTDNFINGVCIGLRRLTEDERLVKRATSKSDHSVYSLQSLLADIQDHRKDYTRRRLFLACKLEYDLDKINRHYWEFVRREYPDGGTFAVPPELTDMPSKLLHQQWDSLSRCPPNRRGPDDLIAADYLDQLRSEIEAIRSAVGFLVNKHIAHAATPQSRSSVEEKNESLTLTELFKLILRAGRAVNSISALLASAVFPFLAVAMFDKWDNWGRGWQAPGEKLEEAWKAWEEKVRRIEPLYPPTEE